MNQNNLGADLRDFIDRVASDDEEGVQATLCIVVNTDSRADSFSAGDPGVLARALVKTIDELSKKVPDFAEAWGDALRAKTSADRVQPSVGRGARGQGHGSSQAEVDALIKKLKGKQ